MTWFHSFVTALIDILLEEGCQSLFQLLDWTSVDTYPVTVKLNIFPPATIYPTLPSYHPPMWTMTLSGTHDPTLSGLKVGSIFAELPMGI